MSKERILVVDDENSLRLLLQNELSRAGYGVETVSDGEAALEKIRENFYHVILLDIVMPKMDGIDVLRATKQENNASEIIILTGNATLETAIECMKLGAFEYIRKPYNLKELLIHIERAIEHHRSLIDLRILKDELVKSGYNANLIGKSKAMLDLGSMISRIAPAQSTVLILGESGSGKEVVARSIHNQSTRSDKTFIPINCASLSETLLESELFGYEKGAFTDAKAQKRGLAEIADGGTLFLDEIGEIPIHFQAKLLRFLETGDIRRVGGTRDIPLNVRIICATNQPLEELVEENKFRADLYYRLNVLSIEVPPLKERVEDIPLLVDNFIALYGFQKKFDSKALEILKAYDWKGNVRELKNVVERTCILSRGRIVSADDLLFLKVSKKAPEEKLQEEAPVEYENDMSLKEVERRHIVSVLKNVKGHRAKAAKVLGISPKTLYLKIKALNIVSTYQ
ncbi:sigma-54 dependent transcriptional regulator [Chitinispirillales bacterium ANBcel5]|uniref:sigma-54-dependent transcriptional regulator n=1 Tax=Cellulosispirillum alkaliphilum TaxID=3039283 RepID=UPI002A571294|nr:sigma-54 dependent transcriptional regulator [Chitinispirillales bacterium ANBcel5]